MKNNFKNSNLIEQINHIKFWGGKDIDFGTALSCHLINRKLWNQNAMENLASRFMNVSDYKVVTNQESKVCFLLTSYNICRKDQTRMFENITDIVKNQMIIQSLPYSKESESTHIYFLPIWYMQLEGIKIPSWQKKMIVMYMYHYLLEARKIFKIIARYKKQLKLVAVFDDIFPIDNIVVQMSKKIGIKTSTFHHAIINGSFKYIEYKYSPSDYFLAWGKYTKDMAVKFGMPEEKVKIIGPITMINGKQIKHQKTRLGIIGVLTRNTLGKKYADDNIEMLCIVNAFAQKYNYKYRLRYHPSDNNSYKKYIDTNLCINVSYGKGKEDTLDNFLEKVDFVVCANSSVFADALVRGKMAFRYIPDREKNEDVCRGIKFGKISTLEQLEDVFNNCKEYSGEKIEKISNYIFQLGDIKKEYLDFFNTFL